MVNSFHYLSVDRFSCSGTGKYKDTRQTGQGFRPHGALAGETVRQNSHIKPEGGSIQQVFIEHLLGPSSVLGAFHRFSLSSLDSAK